MHDINSSGYCMYFTLLILIIKRNGHDSILRFIVKAAIT